MGYALKPRKKWTKDNPSLGAGQFTERREAFWTDCCERQHTFTRRRARFGVRGSMAPVTVGDARARRSGSRYRHRPPACAGSIALFLYPLLDRVLDVLDLVDLDVEQPAADLLDAADVDRLDDVARFRIDRDRAARAFPFHALGGGDKRLGVGLAAGILQGFVDEVHAVPAADAEEVRVAPPGRVVGADEFCVRRGLVVVVVVKGRDETERGVAHDLQRVLLGDFALAQNTGLLRIDAEIHERLTEGCRLRAARDE